MTRRLQPPAVVRLGDADAERARRNHAERIRELQNVPIVGGRLLRNVFLADGVITPVPHGMERPVVAFVSPPRRNGGALGTRPRVHRIDGSTDTGEADPERYLTLYAADWGSDGVYVDVWVF